MYIKFSLKNFQRRQHLGDLSIDGMILKLSLQKLSVCERLDWIVLAMNMVQGGTFADMVMNILVP
jgi:hypothetical protein